MKNLIPHFVQLKYLSDEQSGHFKAYTMFIDLSGFTPLTETLMKQGSAGAEQLSVSLNHIFAPMVGLVYQRGGFIPYFAGDAFTAIFPVEDMDPDKFIETARMLRDLFSKQGLKKTQFGDFQIGIKIGLSFGEVDWGIVGADHKTFYFRGDAIDDCAESEHRAKGQEIIFDKHLMALFDEQTPAFEPMQIGYYRLLDNAEVLALPAQPVDLPALDEEIVSHFFPRSVIDFNELGEFRTVISVFISFTGVDSHSLFNQFITIIVEQINSFSGYFKEVDFGDKGGVALGFFGAPVSFENNTDRALEFIFAVHEELKPLQKRSGLKFRAGITSGLAYTGIVGGPERCQYAAVGNRVNLAARLMINADWGEVLVDSEIQKSRYFNFNHKGDIHYKGIEGSIPTYKLLGRSIADRVVFSGQLIGRKEEVATLIEFASPILFDEFAGIKYVYGEAGIGKSRLSYELRQRLKERTTVNWLTCQADQILKKPFNPFVYFLKNYFEQSPENTAIDNRSNFERRFNWLMEDSEKIEGMEGEVLRKELLRTRSILAALISIYYEDDLWQQLDAKGRYQNTLQALSNLFKVKARVDPLVIELEDGHWYDDSSKAFLEEFIRQISAFPILLLVTSRYDDDGTKPLLIPEELLGKNQIPFGEIDLNILSDEALLDFAEVKLKGQVHRELYELLLRTTNGNPFYLEQILEYFVESNLLELIDGEWHIKDKSIKVSSSINSILMARVDRLSTLVKETVKAAAVIGREFEIPVLSEVMKGHEDFVKRNGNAAAVLKEQIRTAEQGQIWQAMNELRYIFRHSLLREAVYSMQLGTRLRRLHRLIAEAIEKLYATNLDERYVDLAFHYEQAEVREKTDFYLNHAANYARRNFQNQQALEFYNKLLRNLDAEDRPEDQVNILLKKGSVLVLIGQWDDCEQVFEEAKEIARKLDDRLLMGQTNNNLGHLLMLKGNYDEARTCLERAAALFEAIGDNAGTAKVNGDLGNLYFRQGNYNEAIDFFTRSIDQRRRHRLASNPQIVANLGLTHMNQGNYDEGIRCQRAELSLCEAANDKPGMATLNTNLGIVYFEKGDYDAALACYEKGLELSEELGNKLLTSIAIGCIGSVYQRKGDYQRAMELFIRDLELCEELGDKQGMSIAIGLIGELRSVEGEFDIAIQYLERNLELSEELGYQKGIAKAVNTLADIYTFQGLYDKAVAYYDRAIQISRKIKNKLVLGFSLVEKGSTLILKGDYKEAHSIHLEALEIAENLGNPDLIFQALILAANVEYFAGRREIAVKMLKDMLSNTKSKSEQAAVHYHLYKMNGKGNIHRDKAFELYQALYEVEPCYLFKERLIELGSSEENTPKA
ncbi:MAG: tetratricopeptide repeat protein [Bacteroidota bacterium]